MSISENIKFLRKKAGLTQKQLANKATLSIATIQGYEQGKYEPKTDALYKLTSALECNINELLDKPFDMYDSYKEILIENLEDIPQKYIKLTGKDLIDYREKSENSLEIFFCYLESLGYELTILNSNEMKQYHIEPNTEDDFYAGIEDKQRDNVTFFHRIEFENFQKELEKAIAYEIYKQYSKK